MARTESSQPGRGLTQPELCHGHDGVRAYVPGLLGAGCHVVLVSAGALRDRDLFTAVRGIGGHLLTITGGAVGGLDIIRACRHAGAIKSIRLITTKPSHTLAQPWMTGDRITSQAEANEMVTGR